MNKVLIVLIFVISTNNLFSQITTLKFGKDSAIIKIKIDSSSNVSIDTNSKNNSNIQIYLKSDTASLSLYTWIKGNINKSDTNNRISNSSKKIRELTLSVDSLTNYKDGVVKSKPVPATPPEKENAFIGSVYFWASSISIFCILTLGLIILYVRRKKDVNPEIESKPDTKEISESDILLLCEEFGIQHKNIKIKDLVKRIIDDYNNVNQELNSFKNKTRLSEKQAEELRNELNEKRAEFSKHSEKKDKEINEQKSKIQNLENSLSARSGELSEANKTIDQQKLENSKLIESSEIVRKELNTILTIWDNDLSKDLSAAINISTEEAEKAVITNLFKIAIYTENYIRTLNGKGDKGTISNLKILRGERPDYFTEIVSSSSTSWTVDTYAYYIYSVLKEYGITSFQGINVNKVKIGE